jgi:hypothetical protein
MKYLILIIFIFTQCNYKVKNNTSFYKPLHISDSVTYSNHYYQVSNFNPFFNSHVIKYNSIDFLATKPSSSNQIFLYPISPKNYFDSIDLTDFLDYSKGNTILIKDSLICIYNRLKSFVKILRFDASKKNKIVIEKESKVAKIDTSKYWISSLSGMELLDKDTIEMVFAFGDLKNEKNKFLDSKNPLVISREFRNDIDKIGFYPKNYFNPHNYNNHTFFTSDSKMNIIYIFEMHNLIVKLNKLGELLFSKEIDIENNFMEFDWDKESDLAYVRRHTLMSERNVKICALENDQILVLKKLKNDKIQMPSLFKYYVFDNMLNLLYSDTVRHKLNPLIISKYQNGFLLFNDNLTKAYYYEVP